MMLSLKSYKTITPVPISPPWIRLSWIEVKPRTPILTGLRPRDCLQDMRATTKLYLKKECGRWRDPLRHPWNTKGGALESPTVCSVQSQGSPTSHFVIRLINIWRRQEPSVGGDWQASIRVRHV